MLKSHLQTGGQIRGKCLRAKRPPKLLNSGSPAKSEFLGEHDVVNYINNGKFEGPTGPLGLHFEVLTGILGPQLILSPVYRLHVYIIVLRSHKISSNIVGGFCNSCLFNNLYLFNSENHVKTSSTIYCMCVIV